MINYNFFSIPNIPDDVQIKIEELTKVMLGDMKMGILIY